MALQSISLGVEQVGSRLAARTLGVSIEMPEAAPSEPGAQNPRLIALAVFSDRLRTPVSPECFDRHVAAAVETSPPSGVGTAIGRHAAFVRNGQLAQATLGDPAIRTPASLGRLAFS